MRDEVLVIGAGPAGIASAYYLEKAGLPYRVLEREAIPASTWAEVYPSLQLNTAVFVSHLPGMRMPLRSGIFPMGKAYYDYILKYLQKHKFNIEYGVEVERVTPQDGGWCVETTRGADVYRAVIIATGRYGNPITPNIPGMDQFMGRILHAHDFHAPQDFDGQRVLVIGSGPSGVDIAVALADHAAAKPVYLSVRSDIVLARKYPYGLPNTAWQILVKPIPKRWRKRVLDKLVYQGYPDAKEIGLKFAPNREDRVGTSAPVRGHELIDAIRAGTIKTVDGLARFDGRFAVMDNGLHLEVDSVIFGTGYRAVLNFLDFPYAMDDADWHIRIDQNTYQVEGHDGLYLVGWFYRGLGPLYNVRLEAQAVIKAIADRW